MEFGNILSLILLLLGIVASMSILFVMLIRLSLRALTDRLNRFFIWTLILILFWSLFFALEVFVSDLSSKILFAKTQYIGISLLPVAWLLFCSKYTGKLRKLTDTDYYLVLLVIPIVTIFLAFTNDMHGLIWVNIKSVNMEGIILLFPSLYGKWFWVHTAYSYILIISGIYLLIISSLNLPREHKNKIFMLIGAATIPLIANVIYLSRSFLSLQYPLIDPTPSSFSISMILLFLAIYKYKLIDIFPIARNVVMENLRDAILVLDRNNRIIDMNLSAERMLNIRKENLIGRDVSKVSKNCPEIVDIISNIYQSEFEKTCEKENRYFHVKAHVLKDLEGDIIGKVIVISDITELETYKRELERLNKHLEEEVRKRIRRIEEILKQKDEFIAHLSHDLRTPLTPILNLLQILKERVKDEQTKKLVDTILGNADYMKKLVINALNLAKLNLTDTDLKMEKINLRDVVEECIRDNGYSIKTKEINVINRINRDVFVMADKLRLREVLNNLVSNSLKYTPEGGKIEFVANRDGNYVIVEVKDNGIGLKEDQKHKIFDEFYKADESRHDLRSTGLGLAICRRIIEKHGGKIWAESEGPGKGTSIFFTLPVDTMKSKIYNLDA